MAPRRKKVALERKITRQTVQKKQGPARRNVRGKRGGLQNMPEMPLDILLEILRLLEPRDLLNLARTSKPFRELLMSRNSASMWKAARENVEGLPDCPAHLSEPAYANLAFFPYCHGCLQPNVQTVLWEFSTRYCRSCLKANTFSPGYCRSVDKHVWAMSQDHTIFTQMFINDGNLVYHRPELDEIQAVKERLRNDPEAWEAYTQEQKDRVRVLKAHARSCSIWAAMRAMNRTQELQDIRTKRLNDIVEKLRELGWGDELDKIAPGYYPLRNHTHVKVSRPLTNRGWVKMKDELVAQMEAIKQKRVRLERHEVIVQRLHKLTSVILAARAALPKRTVADEDKPRCRDLAMMPEVRRAIEAPNDVEVTEETLQAVVQMLPTLEDRWKRERRAELVQILREGGVDAQDGADSLDLVTAVFKCKECSRFMHHPQVLMHQCRNKPGVYDTAEYQYAEYYKCVYDAFGCKRTWVQSDFCVAPKLERVRALVELCGKDPGVATLADMDAAGIKLVHDEPSSGACVMSWRRAIEYVHRNHRGDFDVTHWRVATDADKAAVKAREDKLRDRKRSSNMQCANFRCAYCGIPRLELTSNALTHVVEILGAVPFKLKAHLKAEHNVEQPSLENGDYYLHPDDDSELEPILVKEPPRFSPFGMGIGFYDSDDYYESDGYGDFFDSDSDEFYNGYGGPLDYNIDPYVEFDFF